MENSRGMDLSEYLLGTTIQEDEPLVGVANLELQTSPPRKKQEMERTCVPFQPSHHFPLIFHFFRHFFQNVRSDPVGNFGKVSVTVAAATDEKGDSTTSKLQSLRWSGVSERVVRMRVGG
jgi:hypothetical protein